MTYTNGDNIRIIDGPFADLNGVVEAIHESTAVVRIDIFGRSTPVELELSQIQPAPVRIRVSDKPMEFVRLSEVEVAELLELDELRQAGHDIR